VPEQTDWCRTNRIPRRTRTADFNGSRLFSGIALFPAHCCPRTRRHFLRQTPVHHTRVTGPPRSVLANLMILLTQRCSTVVRGGNYLMRRKFLSGAFCRTERSSWIHNARAVINIDGREEEKRKKLRGLTNEGRERLTKGVRLLKLMMWNQNQY
jgi:hypothetical protein